MRLTVSLDTCERMNGIGIAVDHVALINDDGGDFRDADTPRIGNASISGGELLGGGSVPESLAHLGSSLSWVGWQALR